MLKNPFKKNEEKSAIDEIVLISALLVHAARADEHYTDNEKKIIINAIIELKKIDLIEAEKILKKSEEKEKNSNQIVEFTREVKKYSMEFRLKIIEIIWKIVYSDGSSDIYESGLMRRISGLLYISDKDNGIIKTKVKNLLK
jgi:uncharacterized tellurite resistance protein B-like protein